MSRFAAWRIWCPLKECLGPLVYGRHCVHPAECMGSGPFANAQPVPTPPRRKNLPEDDPKPRRTAPVDYINRELAS